jgi:hypothetical protein
MSRGILNLPPISGYGGTNDLYLDETHVHMTGTPEALAPEDWTNPPAFSADVWAAG